MIRALVLGAFTLSLAGIGLAQQTGSQAYPEVGQYSGQYNPYGDQYTSSSQHGWQNVPYSGQYSPYYGQRQYTTQSLPRPSWDYGQMSTYEGAGTQWQSDQPTWSIQRPYGLAGHGTWSQTGQPGWMSGQQAPWQYGQGTWQGAQQMPWQQYGHPGAYGTWTPGQTAGFYGQQPGVGGMMSGQGQRLRILGSIEQHIPAQQFSNELNPNDVLVNVRTASGQEQLVDLGPNAENANFVPQPGSRIMVSGHVVFLNGRPVLIARRAHEIGPGMFQQAGFGERGGRFPAAGMWRGGTWRSGDQSGY
jgi:hypothetical protein